MFHCLVIASKSALHFSMKLENISSREFLTFADKVEEKLSASNQCTVPSPVTLGFRINSFNENHIFGSKENTFVKISFLLTG